MRGDERLELGHEIAVPAAQEVRLDPVLERGDPQVFESSPLGLGERQVAEILERRAAPVRVRSA